MVINGRHVLEEVGAIRSPSFVHAGPTLIIRHGNQEII